MESLSITADTIRVIEDLSTCVCDQAVELTLELFSWKGFMMELWQGLLCYINLTKMKKKKKKKFVM